VRVGAAVPVKDANSARTWVEVEGELPDGTAVVTSGQSQLADGTALRVRAAQVPEGEIAK
jgi:hypothetical protein